MRAEKYGGDFPARAIHRIPVGHAHQPLAARRGRDLLRLGYRLMPARYALLLKVKPSAVIGFGGYPTLPPIIAARTLRIPTAIHEQNAVMGRANRLLVALRRPHRAVFHADQAARSRGAGQGEADRHPGARRGAEVSRRALYRARCLLPPAAARVRRQPRRALLFRGAATGASAPARRDARAAHGGAAGPRGGFGGAARGLRATPGSPRISRPSSAICRSGSPRRSSSSPAPAPPPWPS